jgi:hypothetical protein
MAFTINTEESLDTGEGYISIRYNAIFRNAKTDELKGKRDFKETYEKIGNYYLPSCQVINAIDAGGRKIHHRIYFYQSTAFRILRVIPAQKALGSK